MFKSYPIHTIKNQFTGNTVQFIILDEDKTTGFAFCYFFERRDFGMAKVFRDKNGDFSRVEGFLSMAFDSTSEGVGKWLTKYSQEFLAERITLNKGVGPNITMGLKDD